MKARVKTTTAPIVIDVVPRETRSCFPPVEHYLKARIRDLDLEIAILRARQQELEKLLNQLGNLKEGP